MTVLRFEWVGVPRCYVYVCVVCVVFVVSEFVVCIMCVVFAATWAV